jgi:hypothetical protein
MSLILMDIQGTCSAHNTKVVIIYLCAESCAFIHLPFVRATQDFLLHLSHLGYFDISQYSAFLAKFIGHNSARVATLEVKSAFITTP